MHWLIALTAHPQKLDLNALLIRLLHHATGPFPNDIELLKLTGRL